MRRRVCLTTVALLLAAGLVVAAADAVPSIKDIMQKAHRPGTGLLPTLNLDLKDDVPDWEAVQEQTQELAELTAMLPKGSPPQGGQESWQRLSQGYRDLARQLDTAAKKKDRATSRSVLAKLNGSCKACHDIHRPK